MRGLLAVVVGLLGLGVVGAVIGLWTCTAVSVTDQGMEPTLRAGEQVIATKNSAIRRIRRGDLIAFPAPQDHSQIVIRRVVGIPGDKIRIRKGKLILNGDQIPEPYIRILNPELRPVFPTVQDEFVTNAEIQRLQVTMYAESVNDGELTVATGSYFVLGDNRSTALDSRDFGLVPAATIQARPIYAFSTSGRGIRSHAIESYVLEMH